MYYYTYNDKSELVQQFTTQPTSGDSVMSSENFDLDLNTVTIGSISNGSIDPPGYRSISSKPVAQLAAYIASLRDQVVAQAEAIAELSILISGTGTATTGGNA
jgi:hypothetical protein